MKTLLGGNTWKTGNIRKPTVVEYWNEKTVGFGTNIYDIILISIDTEDPQIFSMKNSDSNYDWLHEVSCTIDIRTTRSNKDLIKMKDEVLRILKTNVVFNINQRQYVDMLIDGVQSLNEEYRNIYRAMIGITARRLNP